MKNLLALLLIISTSIAVFGCSGDDGSTDTPPTVDKQKDAEVKKDGGAVATPTQD